MPLLKNPASSDDRVALCHSDQITDRNRPRRISTPGSDDPLTRKGERHGVSPPSPKPSTESQEHNDLRGLIPTASQANQISQPRPLFLTHSFLLPRASPSVVSKHIHDRTWLRWNFALPENTPPFRVFRVFRGSKNTPIHPCSSIAGARTHGYRLVAHKHPQTSV
jgi:hypothetical protein